MLDGNQWTPLKRIEEDVFECTKEIETDNVSICCLRNKNVFTEVIKFMIHKDRSILSKNIFPIVKKYKRNFGKLDKSNFFNKGSILGIKKEAPRFGELFYYSARPLSFRGSSM